LSLARHLGIPADRPDYVANRVGIGRQRLQRVVQLSTWIKLLTGKEESVGIGVAPLWLKNQLLWRNPRDHAHRTFRPNSHTC